MAKRNDVLDDLEQITEEFETREDRLQEAKDISQEWSRGVARAATRAGLGLAISVLDPEDPRLVYVNQAACRILGEEHDDLVGGPPIPDLSSEDKEMLRRQDPGAPGFLETEIRHPDRTEVPVELGISSGTYWGQPATYTFVRDVTDRREAERALERSNEELQEFAQVLSHDLREPLRTVSSFLDLLEDRAEAELSEESLEYVEFARSGAERMQEMIEGLLAYSRVDSSGRPMEPCDLDEAFRRARESLKLRIEDLDADVRAGDLPRVAGDQPQLSQLLQNLIDNALKYRVTDRPPEVVVEADRTPDGCTVYVRDNGCGMDETTRENAFGIFERGPDAEKSGSGIGLAVCKRIMDRHDGPIWIEETAPGEGTTVAFTLPTLDSDGLG